MNLTYLPLPLLHAVRVDETSEKWLAQRRSVLKPRKTYIVMGEVATDMDGIIRGNAYVLLFDIAAGKIIREMFHAEMFRVVVADDAFFPKWGCDD